MSGRAGPAGGRQQHQLRLRPLGMESNYGYSQIIWHANSDWEAQARPPWRPPPAPADGIRHLHIRNPAAHRDKYNIRTNVQQNRAHVKLKTIKSVSWWLIAVPRRGQWAVVGRCAGSQYLLFDCTYILHMKDGLQLSEGAHSGCTNLKHGATTFSSDIIKSKVNPIKLPTCNVCLHFRKTTLNR